MLALAGLVGTLEAQEKTDTTPSGTPAVSSHLQVPYAGLSLSELTEKNRSDSKIEIPNAVGIHVEFVDPSGPSMGVLEEGDILTRFDDQVLMNVPQFQSLVRMHQAGDQVKLTVVRGAEAKVIELKLGARAPQGATAKRALSGPTTSNQGAVPQNQSGVHITINGQSFDIDPLAGGMIQSGPGNVVVIGPNAGIPPEVQKRLDEMRSKGMPIPPLGGVGQDATAKTQVETQQSMSKSWSFSFGNGAHASSSSIASDEHGTVSIEEADGKKHAVIKDNAGKVLFDGDVTTPEQQAALAKNLRDRLKLVEGGNFSIPGVKSKSGDEAPAKPKAKPNPQGA
jgi:hypothetical protein